MAGSSVLRLKGYRDKMKAELSVDGNTGRLNIITHLNEEKELVFFKDDGEEFKMGGTAVNAVSCFEGVILNREQGKFRAFKNDTTFFESIGTFSKEEWYDNHCWITEYYPLDMEGKKPEWFVSINPIKNANHLFVNVLIIKDGNIKKTYRVSCFTGEYTCLN